LAPVAAGGTAEQDLDAALANIFAHPNVAPFISRQLIQHLVTSAPSPAYVGRVTAAFRRSNGDMKTVIKAILLDSEARAGDSETPDPAFGHLREPVLFINGLLRELNARVDLANGLAAQGSNLGQNVYLADSVFNFFSPGYRFQAATGSVNAPEFQILSTSTAMRRADLVTAFLYRTVTGVAIDWTPYLTMTPDQLVQSLNHSLLGGTMSDAMRASVLKAVSAQTTPKAKAQAAAFLIASSSQYAVER
jgi:hypothetical protein